MTDILERRYRRLMWFYPAAYRRQRSGEIIDTLLQGAEDGQRRPTVRNAVALAVGGLRARSDVDHVVSVGTNIRLAARLAVILYAAAEAFEKIYFYDNWVHAAGTTGWTVWRVLIYGILCVPLAVLVWFNRRIAALIVSALIVGASFDVYCPGDSCGVDPSQLVHPIGSLQPDLAQLALPIGAALVLAASRASDRRLPRVWIAVVVAYLVEQNFLLFVTLPMSDSTFGVVYHVVLPLTLLVGLLVWISVDARPALALAMLLTFTGAAGLIERLLVEVFRQHLATLDFIGPPWPAYQVVLAGAVGVLIIMSSIRLRRQARV
ncbi:MAG TPA: hypothetical protein VGJ28_03320 [Micromonosporaceae bacterium]